MEQIRIYLADTDTDHLERVRSALRRHREMNIVGLATDGSVAYKELLETAIDVLILDLQLPGMDGIMLLSALKGMRHTPASIICTRFYSRLSVAMASRNGAAYCLFKPIDYNRLAELVLCCHRECRPESDASESAKLSAADIRRRLTAMGFSSSLSGSLYMTESLLRVQSDRSLMRNLSKGLYAAIAPTVDATPARIERCLRNAISTAYDRGSMSRHFDHRPSNREFFEYMVAWMDGNAP